MTDSTIDPGTGKQSSMRIALYVVIGLTALMVLTVSVTMILLATKGTQPDWSGIATFIGAIGVFLAPAFTGKAIQKKYESK